MGCPITHRPDHEVFFKEVRMHLTAPRWFRRAVEAASEPMVNSSPKRAEFSKENRTDTIRQGTILRMDGGKLPM